MITLTTEHGTFQADDEQAALKLARKAKRDAARQSAIESAERKQAYLYASANGFRLLDALMSEGRMRDSWCLSSPDSSGASIRRVYGDIATKTVYGNPAYRAWGEFGDGEFEMFSDFLLVSVIEGVSGPLGYFVRLPDGSVECHAIGINGSQVVSHRVHGITQEMFGSK